ARQRDRRRRAAHSRGQRHVLRAAARQADRSAELEAQPRSLVRAAALPPGAAGEALSLSKDAGSGCSSTTAALDTPSPPACGGEGGERSEPGEVGLDGECARATVRHLTLPVALTSHGSDRMRSLPLPASRGEGRETGSN